MQVTQLDRNDNYALVGGNREGKFSLNATAYTFKVLYDTLYSDKEMAVVRELMANCYDAMKMAGRPGDPFSVKLTDTEVTFADTGPGIPHDKMAAIFCTMFGSSKTDDPTQIGGFGLGCKSPFALTDHFTVTSYHGGFQVVYAMHRGDETTGGIPGFREMVRVPCGARTGLTVAVPIKDRHQRHKIEECIGNFARWAGMNVMFGGTSDPSAARKLRAYDLTELNRVGFAVFADSPAHFRGERVCVSLGNVLYPLSSDIAGYDTLSGYIPSGLCAVIRAEPGKVGVVPSREAISYTEQTTEYLTELVARWSKNLGPLIEEERFMDVFRRFNKHLKGDIFRFEELGRSRHTRNSEEYGAGRYKAARLIARIKNDFEGERDRDIARLLNKILPSLVAKRCGSAAWRSIKPGQRAWDMCSSREMVRRAKIELVRSRLLRFSRRIAGSTLYGVDRNGMPLRATKEISYRNSPANNIMVVERVKSVEGEMREGSFRSNWSLVVPKLTSALIDQIARECAKSGLNPVFIRADKPEKKVKTEVKVERAKAKFVSVVAENHGSYGRYGVRVYNLGEATIEKPAYYLDLPTRRSVNEKPRGPAVIEDWMSNTRKLNDLYPDTIIPDNAKDRAYCEKHAVPSVIEAMRSEFQAFTKKGKAFELIISWQFGHRPDNRRVTSDAMRVMRPVIETGGPVKLFSTFDIEEEVTDEHQRCWDLAHLVWRLKGLSRVQDNKEMNSFAASIYAVERELASWEGYKLLRDEMPERYNIFDPYHFTHESARYGEMFEEVLAFIDTKFKQGVAA